MASTEPSRAALGRGDLTTSLVFVFPLFIAYEVGVLFTSSANGVDFITRWMYRAVGHSQRNYLLIHAALGACFVVAVLLLRRKRSGSLAGFVPMLLEAAIYALTLGTFIIFVMDRVLGFGAQVALGPTGEAIVSSMGAGVHEELVFRLITMGGLAYVLCALGARRSVAVAVALAISAALFSAAHHVGPYGDPWSGDVFVYRVLAGALFGAIYYFRSLAHAVYAHFLYDVYVMLIV